MNNKTDIDVKYVSPLKKILMTIGELPSSYLETMTYYEMLVWFTEFLRNQVIPTVNNNAEAVQELQILYEELRQYVNNYLDTQNFQEMVNNKLDDMLESGELNEIIEQILQSTSVWCYDTVADMQSSTNLLDGSYAKTLGYYSINDGGGAYYKISSTSSENDYQVQVGNLYATLIYSDKINANQVGIIGDGTTDYSEEIRDFIYFCMNNNVVAYFPKGTYIISSETIEINIKEGKTVNIEGNYKSTLFKRISGTLGPTKWNRLFTLLADENNTINTGDIVIKNISIDSNRRGQSNATSDYTYEFSADIFFRGTENSHIPNIYLDDLYFYDGVADHLDFSSSVSNYIENIYINNFLAEHREGTRNDICFPGYCLGNIYISNTKAKRLHFEYNTNPSNYSKVFVSNSEFDELEYSGKIEFINSNLVINKNFSTGSAKGTFENCLFNLDGNYQRSYIINSNVSFNDCKFITHYTTLYSEDATYTYCSYLFVRNGSTANFNNCYFEYANDEEISHVNGRNYMLTTSANSSSGDVPCTVNLNDTKFNGQNIHAFFAYGNNTFNVNNCDFGDTDNFHSKVITAAKDLYINLYNIKLNPNKYFCYLDGAGATITGDKIICNDKNFVIVSYTTNNFQNSTFNLKRKVYITQPITTDYLTSLLNTTTYLNMCKNDELIYNDSVNNPYKWIVKMNKSGPITGYSYAYVNKIEEIFSVVSNGARGITDDRPTCYLTKGFEYYDTTLNKPIWYNGSNWIDSTGTQV